MAYELEYKKVHNTLGKSGQNSIYGFTKGQKITNIFSDTQILIELKETARYFVIKTSSAASIKIEGYDGQNYWEKCFIDGLVIVDYLETTINGYKLLVVPPLTTLWTAEINGSPVNGQVLPYLVLSSQSDDIIMWETDKDNMGIIEDTTITEIVYVSSDSSDPNYHYRYDAVLNSTAPSLARLFANCNTINTTWNSDGTSVAINLDLSSQAGQEILADLANYNLNLVLIPVSRKGNILKSITNTRNRGQISLYKIDDINYWKPCSAFIEPIILLSADGTIRRTSIAFSAATTEINKSDWDLIYSRRGHLTYGLNNESKILRLISGCGYQSGEHAGVTQTSFAIGIQRPKNKTLESNNLYSELPHSGCTLEWIKFYSDQYHTPVSLNRQVHPLVEGVSVQCLGLDVQNNWMYKMIGSIGRAPISINGTSYVPDGVFIASLPTATITWADGSSSVVNLDVDQSLLQTLYKYN